ncbi:MAG: cytochrome c biogenesis protein CcsA [Cyclobacteriaceae bacterium]|jgi:heme exporter protein C|nr:cytochrome c biogenesis protein CcsA [Flammeovirgaceae bacterium]
MSSFLKKFWWKYLCVALLTYTTVAGLLVSVPRLAIVNETIRALYFHVPMWFGMVAMFGFSIYYSIQYLRKQDSLSDFMAAEFANTGLLLGILGILTGMLWANYTWGSPWHGDPKQNGAAIALLVYLAYFVLRGSLDNIEQRARLSAVYNIFAFAAMIPLIFVIPRLQDSMHPGSGGNPGFNVYDLDSRMRLVFYPAVIGWILLGVWVAGLQVRARQIKQHLEDV